MHLHSLSYTFGYTRMHYHTLPDKISSSFYKLSYTSFEYIIEYTIIQNVIQRHIKHHPASFKTSSDIQNVIRNVIQRHPKRHRKRHPTSSKTSSYTIIYFHTPRIYVCIHFHTISDTLECSVIHCHALAYISG